MFKLKNGEDKLQADMVIQVLQDHFNSFGQFSPILFHNRHASDLLLDCHSIQAQVQWNCSHNRNCGTKWVVFCIQLLFYCVSDTDITDSICVEGSLRGATKVDHILHLHLWHPVILLFDNFPDIQDLHVCCNYIIFPHRCSALYVCVCLQDVRRHD